MGADGEERGQRDSNDQLAPLIAAWSAAWNGIAALAEERTRIRGLAFGAYKRVIDETDRDLPEGDKLWRIDQDMQRLEAELDRNMAAIVKCRAQSAACIASKLDMALLMMRTSDPEGEQIAELIESARADLNAAGGA